MLLFLPVCCVISCANFAYLFCFFLCQFQLTLCRVISCGRFCLCQFCLFVVFFPVVNAAYLFCLFLCQLGLLIYFSGAHFAYWWSFLPLPICLIVDVLPLCPLIVLIYPVHSDRLFCSCVAVLRIRIHFLRIQIRIQAKSQCGSGSRSMNLVNNSEQNTTISSVGQNDSYYSVTNLHNWLLFVVTSNVFVTF